MPVLDNGEALCPCLSQQAVDAIVLSANLTYAAVGGTQYSAFGSDSVYASHYGVGCLRAHDSGTPPYCMGRKEDLPSTCSALTSAVVPSWCANTWCWIDPQNCTLASGNDNSGQNSSYFAGSGLVYSYETCGKRDEFTSFYLVLQKPPPPPPPPPGPSFPPMALPLDLNRARILTVIGILVFLFLFAFVFLLFMRRARKALQLSLEQKRRADEDDAIQDAEARAPLWDLEEEDERAQRRVFDREGYCAFYFVDANWLRTHYMHLVQERESSTPGRASFGGKRLSSIVQARISKGLSDPHDDGSAFLRRQESISAERVMAKLATAPDGTFGYGEGKSLPSFQKLKTMPRSPLVRLLISKKACLQHLYKRHILAVSHRWQAKGEPDEEGQQFTAVVAHVLTNPEVQYVWFDFWCMPQSLPDQPRTRAEDAAFIHMLKNVNFLYLGARVLILLDRSYMGRFWTVLEAWIAMRKADASGLVESTIKDDKRWSVMCPYETDVAVSEQWRRTLEMDYLHKSLEDTKATLLSPDIEVTNKKDKETQIPKLTALNEQVITLNKPKESAIRQAIAKAASGKFNMASIQEVLSSARNSQVEKATVETIHEVSEVDEESVAESPIAAEESGFELSLPATVTAALHPAAAPSASEPMSQRQSLEEASSLRSAFRGSVKGGRRSLPAKFGQSFGEDPPPTPRPPDK